jgi:hypothetical protein
LCARAGWELPDRRLGGYVRRRVAASHAGVCRQLERQPLQRSKRVSITRRHLIDV